MLIAVSIMLISACEKKEKLYEIPDLSQYKTDYVGDSSNVINIVSNQEYPEGYSYDSIEIQSETEPFIWNNGEITECILLCMFLCKG